MRDDNVARIVYGELCSKYGLGRAEKWYGQTPEMSIKITNITMLSYIIIQWDRKPDILVVNKEDKYMHYGYNITCPREDRQEDKEIGKLGSFKMPIVQILWKAIPIVIDSLRTQLKVAERRLQSMLTLDKK